MPSVRVTCRFAGAAYKFLYGHDISGNNWISLTSPQEQIECLKQDTAVAAGAVGIGRRGEPNRANRGAAFRASPPPLPKGIRHTKRGYLPHLASRPPGAAM